MANFPPLNDYTLYILNKLIRQYHLKSPFLDAGCGMGFISKFLAAKGWEGKAIDLSSPAVKNTKKELSNFPKVKVARESILNQDGRFNTIILFDVLEHMKDDEKILRKIEKTLANNGFLILAVTTNPKEWRWDDEFYGHYRRYSKDEISAKLEKIGLRPIECIEYTFPVFWFIRRLYTALLKPPSVNIKDKAKRTRTSAITSSWSVHASFSVVMKLNFLWRVVFLMQYIFFKGFTSYGFATLVLAKKKG